MLERIVSAIENSQTHARGMVQNQKDDGQATKMFAVVLRGGETRAGEEEAEDTNASTEKDGRYKQFQGSTT